MKKSCDKLEADWYEKKSKSKYGVLNRIMSLHINIKRLKKNRVYKLEKKIVRANNVITHNVLKERVRGTGKGR